MLITCRELSAPPENRKRQKRAVFPLVILTNTDRKAARLPETAGEYGENRRVEYRLYSARAENES